MTFAYYSSIAGWTIYQHSHPGEEAYEVVEGELPIIVNGVAERVKPGLVAIVPPNARHFVRAITDGKLIAIDGPNRRLTCAAVPG